MKTGLMVLLLLIVMAISAPISLAEDNGDAAAEMALAAGSPGQYCGLDDRQ